MFTLSNAFFPYIGGPGLSVAIDGGVVINNGSSVFIPAQTISLAANTTTYIFLNTSSNVVQSNTSGFPSSNCYPIAIVATANATITTITDMRPDIQGGGSGSGTTRSVLTTDVSAGGTFTFSDAQVTANSVFVFIGSPASAVTATFPNTTTGTFTVVNSIVSGVNVLAGTVAHPGTITVSTASGALTQAQASVYVSSSTLIDAPQIYLSNNGTANGNQSLLNLVSGVGIGIADDGNGDITLSSTISGTVTSFSSGNLSPLFTTSVATPTTTPALTFAQVNQNANLVFSGPSSGGAAAPTFRSLVAADIPNTTITPIWNNLQNATGVLTLANGTNATTFNQTSAVNWTWANTTAATSGTSQSSPIFNINGTYWNGSASATDSWTIQNSVPNGTNPASTLLFSHTGSTGNNQIIFAPSGISGGEFTFISAPGLSLTILQVGTLSTTSGVVSLATVLGGAYTISPPNASGTITLTLPTTANVLAGQLAGDGTIFSTSLVTASTAGTLTLPTPKNQTANTFFSGPTSGGAAAPTFRTIVNADIPNGTVLWNQIGNASGSLTLANAGNATTFNQTSAVNWTWANTTAATSGTSQSSPTHSFNGNFWNGSASATDSWTIQNVVANGTNSTSQLQFVHSGTTGAASVVVPAGSTSANGLQFSGLSVGLWATAANLNVGFAASGTLNFYNSSTLVGSISTTNPLSLNSQAGSSVALTTSVSNPASANTAIQFNFASNLSNSGSAVTQTAVGTSPTFNPTSGSCSFVALGITPTINQTSSASGSYTGLLVNVIETALLGSSNKLFSFQSGVSGGTVRFDMSNVGIATTYNSQALVGKGLVSNVSRIDLTAQSAAITATNLYAVPAGQGGLYVISWAATVTTAATSSSTLGGTNGFQIVYTGLDDSVVKTTVAGNSITSAGNTTATAIGGQLIGYVKGGTTIQYKFDYTSSGATAMQYNLHISTAAY